MMLPPLFVIEAYERTHGDGSFWRLYRRVILAAFALAIGALFTVAAIIS